ncbi:MAG: hypothetical protein OP8BY_0010 [Candidatus Saccharicenans subterraneus]|uniref:Uncharacterized protein n=1 Tax=Candidatus Saccharicenans subterraneus TaxID=2508984 RepID=A0A3E2BLK8_9BACT|nr:MAG: hypothetical protein OP8BY_0010 [Candidatus Saccharicenans subterraneum]
MKNKFASVYSGPIKISPVQSMMTATIEKLFQKTIKLKKSSKLETHQERRNKIQGKEGHTFLCPEFQEKFSNIGNPA